MRVNAHALQPPSVKAENIGGADRQRERAATALNVHVKRTKRAVRWRVCSFNSYRRLDLFWSSLGHIDHCLEQWGHLRPHTAVQRRAARPGRPDNLRTIRSAATPRAAARRA
eukprot:6975074-Prymnesium_polylepis.1